MTIILWHQEVCGIVDSDEVNDNTDENNVARSYC